MWEPQRARRAASHDAPEVGKTDEPSKPKAHARGWEVPALEMQSRQLGAMWVATILTILLTDGVPDTPCSHHPTHLYSPPTQSEPSRAGQPGPSAAATLQASQSSSLTTDATLDGLRATTVVITNERQRTPDGGSTHIGCSNEISHLRTRVNLRSERSHATIIPSARPGGTQGPAGVGKRSPAHRWLCGAVESSPTCQRGSPNLTACTNLST